MPTLPVQLFDLSSFQVLKGPQGTLFGRSTTGGAVLVVPQAPTDDFGGYARIQGGTFGDFQLEAAVNIPLAQDKALFRVAAYHWSRDGYMTALPLDPDGGHFDLKTGRPLGVQHYANQDTTEVRATLLLTPTDNFTNSPMFTYHVDQAKGSAGSGLVLGPLGEAEPAPGFGTRTTYTAMSFRKPVTDALGVINTSTLNLSDTLSLKNIFGYLYAKGYTNDAEDSDGTSATTVDVYLPPRPRINRQITDEVQLQGKALDQKLSWTLGGLMDLTREPGMDGDVSKLNYASYTSSAVVPNTTDTPSTTISSLSARYQSNRFTSYGLYAAGTYKITDWIGLSAGYRHGWDNIQATQGQATQANFYAPAIVQGISHFKTKFQSDVYNAGIDIHPTQHVMLYGGYRHGFKRGGFNSSSLDPATASFAPEKVDDYYIGVKTDFTVGGMKGRFNAEGFYDFYKGYQVSYLSAVFAPVFQLVTITTNVPKTIYRGGELELTLEPARWLELDGSYSYTDAFFKKWPDTTLEPAVPASSLPSLTANHVTYNSKNKYSVSARIHAELPGDKGELVLQPRVSYQSRFFTTPFNVVEPGAYAAIFGQFNQEAHGGAIVPGYTLLDLRLEWNHFLGSRFDLANATNLTNKTYFLGNGGTLNFGVQGNAYGPPRMFTFEVSTNF
jgi:iron complex outermembrane receptor protein